jgi:hypothetical protein
MVRARIVRINDTNSMRMKRSVYFVDRAAMEVAHIAPTKRISTEAAQTSADGVVQLATEAAVPIILTGYTRSDRRPL